MFPKYINGVFSILGWIDFYI